MLLLYILIFFMYFTFTMISLVPRARCAADLFSKNVRIMKKRSLPHLIPRFIGSVRGFHLAYYSYFGLFLRSFHGQLDPLHLDSEESDPPRPTFWLSKRKSEPVKEALYFVDLTFLWKGLHARLQWLARVSFSLIMWIIVELTWLPHLNSDY